MCLKPVWIQPFIPDYSSCVNATLRTSWVRLSIFILGCWKTDLINFMFWIVGWKRNPSRSWWCQMWDLCVCLFIFSCKQRQKKEKTDNNDAFWVHLEHAFKTSKTPFFTFYLWNFTCKKQSKVKTERKKTHSRKLHQNNNNNNNLSPQTSRVLLTFCCAWDKGFAPILTESRAIISPHATKYDKFILTPLVNAFKDFFFFFFPRRANRNQPISYQS